MGNIQPIQRRGKAIVLFSGGQDSTTCLFAARATFEKVIALTIDYGQRHGKAETEAAREIAFVAGVEHLIVAERAFAGLDNSLTADMPIAEVMGLPTTFVPGRNLLFLTIAAAYAYDRGIDGVAIGASAIDYSGYPDCRPEALVAFQAALRLALGKPEFAVYAPLVGLTKVQMLRLARALGAESIVRAISHTCYNGVSGGCGVCPACEIRRKADADFAANPGDLPELYFGPVGEGKHVVG